MDFIRNSFRYTSNTQSVIFIAVTELKEEVIKFEVKQLRELSNSLFVQGNNNNNNLNHIQFEKDMVRHKCVRMN